LTEIIILLGYFAIDLTTSPLIKNTTTNNNNVCIEGCLFSLDFFY